MVALNSDVYCQHSSMEYFAFCWVFDHSTDFSASVESSLDDRVGLSHPVGGLNATAANVEGCLCSVVVG